MKSAGESCVSRTRSRIAADRRNRLGRCVRSSAAASRMVPVTLPTLSTATLCDGVDEGRDGGAVGSDVRREVQCPERRRGDRADGSHERVGQE